MLNRPQWKPLLYILSWAEDTLGHRVFGDVLCLKCYSLNICPSYTSRAHSLSAWLKGTPPSATPKTILPRWRHFLLVFRTSSNDDKCSKKGVLNLIFSLLFWIQYSVHFKPERMDNWLWVSLFSHVHKKNRKTKTSSYMAPFVIDNVLHMMPPIWGCHAIKEENSTLVLE